MADHNRAFRAILDLIADTGAAQAAQIAADNGGKMPETGFWRVEPPVDQRSPGVTVYVYSPTGGLSKTRIPRNGCTEHTVRILTQGVQRWGFDITQAKTDQKARLRAAREKEAEQAAAAERSLHDRHREAQPQPVAVKRKMRKKWPKEEVVRCDIDAIQALNLLDDPGDGSRRPRALSRANVDRFKRIITEGRWIADYMQVDCYGQVFNGRHRLTAIAELEDWIVPCAIIYGANRDAFAVMDTPYRRTAAHALFVDGLASKQDQGRMSAALKLLYDCKSDKPLESWGRETIDNDMVIGLAHQYPDINQAMIVAEILHTGRRDGVARFMPSAAIVFAYLAMEAWPGCGKILDQYMLGVTRAEEMPATDPRMRLYRLMMSQQGGQRRGGDAAKSAQIFQLVLLLKYWNKFCKGERMNKAASWEAREGVPIPVTESQVVPDA